MNYFYELVKYDTNIPGKILLQDKPGWRCNTRPHWHSELEFVYMIKGSLKATINGKEQTIHSGEFYFCNPKVIHSTCTPDNTSQDKYIVLLLSHDLLLRFHEKCLFDITDKESFEKLKNQLQQLSYLAELPSDEYPAYYLDIEKNKVLLEICKILLSDCASPDVKPHAPSFSFTGYAKTIMEYVCENYQQKLSLQTIADITDAALSSGFSDVKTYVRICKSVYGMTLSAYRKAIHNSEV